MIENFYVQVHPEFVFAMADRGNREAIGVRQFLRELPLKETLVIPVGQDPAVINRRMPGVSQVNEVVVCGAFVFSKAGSPQCVNTQALALKVAGYRRVIISQQGSLKSRC